MSGYISSKLILPSGSENPKFLIIGEYPDESDERAGRCCEGERGETYQALLSASGINKSDCRSLYLFPWRPAGGNIGYVTGSDALGLSVDAIRNLLRSKKPEVVILMGELPLQQLLEKYKIHLHRGSLYELEGVKCIPTYSFYQLKKDASIFPHTVADFEKARRICGRTYRSIIPSYEFITDPSGVEAEEAVNFLSTQPILANDIETSRRDPSFIRCSGFAYSPTQAIVFRNHVYPGIDLSFRRIHERLLGNPRIGKIYHNGIFDIGRWQDNGITVENFFGDTMLNGHVLCPEYPRSLAFLTSIHTNQPYYKGMTKEGEEDTKGWNDKVSDTVLMEYNGIDCCSTFDVYVQQIEELAEKPDSLALVKTEIRQSFLAIHLSEGLPIDINRRNLLRNVLNQKWYNAQEFLNNIHRREINVKSPKLKDLLYGELGLPERRKRAKQGEKGSVTTDEDAIISLIAFAKDKFDSAVREDTKHKWRITFATLKLILEIRGYRTSRSNYVDYKLSNNNLCRSSYKVAATETARWAADKYIDGTGNNAQTFAREVLEYDADKLAVFCETYPNYASDVFDEGDEED